MVSCCIKKQEKKYIYRLLSSQAAVTTSIPEAEVILFNYNSNYQPIVIIGNKKLQKLWGSWMKTEVFDSFRYSYIGKNGSSLITCVRAYVHCLCRPEHEETASLLRTTVPDFSGSSSLVAASPTSASSHPKTPFQSPASVFTGFSIGRCQTSSLMPSGESSAVSPHEPSLSLWI